MANEDVEAEARDAWWRLNREERLRSLRFGPKGPKPLLMGNLRLRDRRPLDTFTVL